jgi:hypothetical protein
MARSAAFPGAAGARGVVSIMMIPRLFGAGNQIIFGGLRVSQDMRMICAIP